MFKTLAAVALVAGLAAAPATALTYDAFTSFNAVNGTGGFSYGSYDGIGFTAFTQNTSCVIGNVTCLRGSSVDLPSVFKADGSATSNGSVLLAPDRLLVHPGEFAQSVYVAFTATAAATYAYTAQFNRQDQNAAQHSVGVTEFYTPFGGPTQFFTRVVVDQSTPSILTGFTGVLNAGDAVGYVVDKNGVYFNDSTGLNFSLTTVPEPATWGLMIVGFGLVGVASRRKAALAA